MIDNDRKGVKSLIWSSIVLIRFIILTKNCGAVREWVGHSDSWTFITFWQAMNIYRNIKFWKFLR